MKIVSSYSHPHDILKLSVCLYLVEHKRFLEEYPGCEAPKILKSYDSLVWEMELKRKVTKVLWPNLNESVDSVHKSSALIMVSVSQTREPD